MGKPGSLHEWVTHLTTAVIHLTAMAGKWSKIHLRSCFAAEILGSIVGHKSRTTCKDNYRGKSVFVLQGFQSGL